MHSHGEKIAIPVNDPRSTVVAGWFDQALMRHRTGDLVQAQVFYQRVLDVQPEHPEALNFLGILMQQRGQSVQAEQLIRRAIRAVPSYAAAYTNLGNILMVRRRYEDAIAAYRQATLCKMDEIDAWVNMGAVLRGLGRLPEALEAYRQASKSNPTNAEIHHRLGLVLAELEQLAEAITAQEAALRCDAGHEEAIKQLGSLLHRVGRDEDARVALGNTVFQLGEDPMALRLLQYWLQLMPDDPIAQHRLAAWFGQEEETPARASDAYVTYLFDRYAEGFDRHLRQELSYQAPEVIANQIAEIVGAPAADLDVLDAGCGTGLCAPLLRPYARRLVGVDLSPRMLDKARERGGYDELLTAELTAYLETHSQSYDLIVLADTLVYFGALEAVFAAAATSLRAGGWLAFTVEAATKESPPSGFRINQSGRYCHTAEYLQQTLTQVGMEIRSMTTATLRQECDQPMTGYVILARRSIILAS
ncbi:MAG: tetratricopeptide repeat protein [Phycisphaerales bacterium]|nr:tetratricopeptide repeat protein [Phycisphaerales bacterium]